MSPDYVAAEDDWATTVLVPARGCCNVVPDAFGDNLPFDWVKVIRMSGNMLPVGSVVLK